MPEHLPRRYVAHEHPREVERKIADLVALRRELDGLIGQCRRGTVAECRIVEALSPAPASPRTKSISSLRCRRG